MNLIDFELWPEFHSVVIKLSQLNQVKTTPNRIHILKMALKIRNSNNNRVGISVCHLQCSTFQSFNVFSFG